MAGRPAQTGGVGGPIPASGGNGPIPTGHASGPANGGPGGPAHPGRPGRPASGGRPPRRPHRGRRVALAALLVAVLALVIGILVPGIAATVRPPQNEGVEIKPNVVVYDQEKSPFKILASDDSSVTVSSMDGINANTILSAGVTDATPNGLLRKISSYEQVDGGYKLNTTQAALTDAIEKCDITAEVTFDDDGNPQVSQSNRPDGSSPFDVRQANAAEPLTKTWSVSKGVQVHIPIGNDGMLTKDVDTPKKTSPATGTDLSKPKPATDASASAGTDTSDTSETAGSATSAGDSNGAFVPFRILNDYDPKKTADSWNAPKYADNTVVNSLNSEVGGGAGLSLKLKIDHGTIETSLVANVNATTRLGINFDTDQTGKFDLDEIDLINLLAKHGIPVDKLKIDRPFDVQVGPVPVVLRMSLTPKATVKPAVQGKALAWAEADIDKTLGYTYSTADGLHAVNEDNSSAPEPHFDLKGDASLDAYLGVDLSVKLYGLAGPALSAGLEAHTEAHVRATTEPDPKAPRLPGSGVSVTGSFKAKGTLPITGRFVLQNPANPFDGSDNLLDQKLFKSGDAITLFDYSFTYDPAAKAVEEAKAAGKTVLTGTIEVTTYGKRAQEVAPDIASDFSTQANDTLVLLKLDSPTDVEAHDGGGPGTSKRQATAVALPVGQGFEAYDGKHVSVAGTDWGWWPSDVTGALLGPNATRASGLEVIATS